MRFRSVCRVSGLESVVFDMDGVIIDSHPAHRKAWQKFLCVLGKEVSEAELDFILDGRKRCDILRYFLGDLSSEESAEFGRQKDEFFQQAALELTPLPGVLDFLSSLDQQNVRLGVATSASASRTHSTLERLQLDQYFRVVVTGDDVQKGKPDPTIYRVVCSKLAVDPQSSIAVEDAVSGIRAAQAAGLKCIGVGRDHKQRQLRAAGAHEVIQDFIGFSPGNLQHIIRSQSFV